MSEAGLPDSGADAAAEPTCATCGMTATGDEVATARLTWTRGVENGRDVWTCTQCSRRYLRSIEGKLDSDWW